MNSIIITKWIEPYVLLETVKSHYNGSVLNFTTESKDIEKKKFLKALQNSKNSIGLYMKNVNKYYFFVSAKNIKIVDILKDEFEFLNSDLIKTDDVDELFEMVDMGQAEAGIIGVN